MDEVTSADQAIRIFEECAAHAVAEAIMFLRDAADELSVKQVQKLVPAVTSFLEKAKANERTTSSILDMLQDVFTKANLSRLNQRDLIKLVNANDVDQNA